jgi:hypothetical protein
MSFNLEKYLVENNLTVISKKRNALTEEKEEPSTADVASAEKQIGAKGIDKKIKEFDQLQKQVKAILAKHSYRDPSGALKIKDVAAYKAEVGNMPDRLKSLKADIDKAKGVSVDSEEEQD